jgi:hypothetical protein
LDVGLSPASPTTQSRTPPVSSRERNYLQLSVALPPATPEGPISITRDPPPSRKMPARSLAAVRVFHVH